MGAAWMRARAELRVGWRGLLAIGLLVGLAAGVVFTAAAGARRTGSAYARMLEVTDAPDVFVSSGDYDAIRALPEVDEASETGLYILSLLPFADDGSTIVVGAGQVDADAFRAFGRPLLLSGRMPAVDEAGEVLATHVFAERFGLGSGDRVEAALLPQDGGEPVELELLITGVGAFPDQIEPSTDLEGYPRLVLTPAFVAAHAGAGAADGLYVRLREGADPAPIQRLAEFYQDLRQPHEKVIRAIRPQAVALGAFAALAALCAAFILGQVVWRNASLAADEHPILRSLGMRRADLILVALGRGAIIGAGAAVVGVALAILASRSMPVGPAAVAEPSPGISVDLVVLVPGLAAVVVLVALACVLPALRAARTGARFGGEQRGAASRPSRISRVASHLTGPVGSTGMRMALEPGRGRTAVPVRSALIGAVVALASLIAALTFGADLDRLVSTPSAYGWAWDLSFDAEFGVFPSDAFRPVLDGEPAVVSYAAGSTTEDVRIGDRFVPALAIEAFGGPTYLTMVEGRPAVTAGEIVLGTRTMREAGTHVGDTVEAEIANEPRRLQVVGRAVFPRIGKGSFEPTGLGEGAALVPADVPGVGVPDPGIPEGGPVYNFVLVRLTPGADRDAVGRRIGAAIGSRLPEGCDSDEACGLVTDAVPAEIANYRAIEGTPLALAAVLALLGVATIGHALVTSVRRRARDLAVLKVIGFERRQVRLAVGLQSSVFAVCALVLGIPLGIAAGGWAWTLMADAVGVPADRVVPLGVLAVTIPATVLLAIGIAAIPARAASRTQPALVFRSE